MSKNNLRSLLYYGMLTGVAVVPALVHAQTRLRDLLHEFSFLVDTLIGVVASLALLVFFWGLVKYIASAGNEQAKDQGKRIMIGGIIAIFVMFSVFGLVRFLREAFFISGENVAVPPRVITPPVGGGQGGN